VTADERPAGPPPEAGEPTARRADGLRDSAPRRTWLAAERTYLAWLRTGLGALGLALAVGRLIPALIESSHSVFAVLGAGFGLLGAWLIVFAALRLRHISAALHRDEPLPEEGWAMTVTTVAALALAAVTIALVIVEV
jgi:putative membrane protein